MIVQLVEGGGGAVPAPIVTLIVFTSLIFPGVAVSMARTETVCAPVVMPGRLFMTQLVVPVAGSQAPPSTLASTLLTPMLSEAVPERVVRGES